MNLNKLEAAELQQLRQVLTPKMTRYIPIEPTAKQTAGLLMNDAREMLYGGAAGGGKSVFLLAAALQFVDIPGYAAILFRKTFSDLMLPGALIPMSQAWLAPYLSSGEVRWQDKEKRYTFLDTGATLSFGYLDSAGDELRYQGAEFQFIGMDECTHIDPVAYRYLFSRLRRLKKTKVPMRFRATCNPGGTFGEYYYQRFFVDNVDEDGKQLRYFLQAGLADNPHLDVEAYRESLAELDEVTRLQLEEGNWEIRPSGDLFDTDWLRTISYTEVPAHARWVRFWDLAAIDPRFRKKSRGSKLAAPDWTVGLKMAFADGNYIIDDIIKVQKNPGEVEQLIARTSAADGYSCAVRIEEEGGASGIANTERYAKTILQGYDFMGVKPVASKIERARPFAAAMQVGNVYVTTRCRHLTDLYAQLTAFPNGANDDIVDACSGAFVHFRPKAGIIAPPLAQVAHQAYNSYDDSRLSGILAKGSYWHAPMDYR